MRTRNCELGGVGHPLVDALLTVCREPTFAGEAAKLGARGTIVARYLVRYENDAGRPATRIVTLKGRPDGRVEPVERIGWLAGGAGAYAGIGASADVGPGADAGVDSAGFRAEVGTGAGRSASEPSAAPEASPDAGALAGRFEAVKNSMILDWIPDRYRRARVTSQLVGLHRQ